MALLERLMFPIELLKSLVAKGTTSNENVIAAQKYLGYKISSDEDIIFSVVELTNTCTKSFSIFNITSIEKVESVQ